MKEIYGDIWELIADADACCLTTNGSLVRMSQGRWRGVMGRGVARQARDRYPDLELRLGTHIGTYGNHVGILHKNLIAFPVKHTWDQRADLKLIARSADELATLVRDRQWQKVLLPRPGCGNGGLSWEHVRPLLVDRLPDSVSVVDLL